MIDRFPSLSRRTLLAGVGGALLTPALPRSTIAQAGVALDLEAVVESIVLLPGQPATPVWRLKPVAGDAVPRFRPGDIAAVSLANRLPSPIALHWRGLDGLPEAEPFLKRPPVAPGERYTFTIPFRHAGTSLCSLVPDGEGPPPRSLPVIVQEATTLAVDRDDVLLIENVRLRPDGSGAGRSDAPAGTTAHYTINGQPARDITVRPNQRLRFRIINSCQYIVLFVKFDIIQVTVMAIDGQPSEPFPARDGRLLLAPGNRIDVIVDVTEPAGQIVPIALHDGVSRPVARLVVAGESVRSGPLPAVMALPSNGLPTELALKTALRIDLALGVPQEWQMAPAMSASAIPAFKVKRGRTVVLALSNKAAKPTVFHLHGHHFRLLDRLDDGWKPFWLDTLAIDTGQTQRVAFVAEHAGAYLMEAITADWAAPLLRSYLVE